MATFADINSQMVTRSSVWAPGQRVEWQDAGTTLTGVVVAYTPDVCQVRTDSDAVVVETRRLRRV
jgi:hypothetical protein